MYVVVHQRDMPSIETSGLLESRLVTPGKNYIGLRLNATAALERYRLHFGNGVPTEQLVALGVNFTERGFVNFATEICDGTHHFCPRLHKKIFNDANIDWGVWHFAGDLPLNQPDMLVLSYHELLTS